LIQVNDCAGAGANQARIPPEGAGIIMVARETHKSMDAAVSYDDAHRCR
jgi:hypothetical protein